jgi:sulfate transport system substrate-binding protein
MCPIDPTPEGQEIVAQNDYRPRDATVAARHANQFATVELIGIDHFGGWKLAQQTHFATGGIFDQITANSSGIPR